MSITRGTHMAVSGEIYASIDYFLLGIFILLLHFTFKAKDSHTVLV